MVRKIQPHIEILLNEMLEKSENKMRAWIIYLVTIDYLDGNDEFFTGLFDLEVKENKEFIDFTSKVQEMINPKRREFLESGGIEKFIELIQKLNDKNLLRCYRGQCCLNFR